MQQNPATESTASWRIKLWYALLVVIFSIVLVRLFYLQIIRQDYYKQTALSRQLKEYEIPAERGVIEAYNGDEVVPIVLNETKYTLFADPVYVEDVTRVAVELQKIAGGSVADYESAMRQETRYAVLAKKLSAEQKARIDALEFKGIGTRAESYRTYPQGSLAAQVLGFVNDAGEGVYGIEEALQESLKGKPGQLKAITDAEGIPLVSNSDNVVTPAEPGERIGLTLDIAVQKQTEDILKAGLDAAQSASGSAVIMNPTTGAIIAMANYPSYDPAEYAKVEDAALYANPAVSSPLEVGSIMKPLTLAAALDQGVVTHDTSYFDPSRYTIDGYTIKNIEEDGGAGTRTMADILQLSLNTGATWLLMQMGGGEVNEKARLSWYDYMTSHYRLGRSTGIEQGFEAEGIIPDPLDGFGLNLQYANTSFGQGMTATPLQMAGALAAVVNGGTYYQPRLVDYRVIDGERRMQTPIVLKSGVVKPETASIIRQLMVYTIDKNYRSYGLPGLREGISIGGKTGTAEVPKPEGGYYEDRFNGTFMGYVGGSQPEYVIVVRVNEPKIPGYAGSKAAAPIFSRLATMLIDTRGITP